MNRYLTIEQQKDLYDNSKFCISYPDIVIKTPDGEYTFGGRTFFFNSYDECRDLMNKIEDFCDEEEAVKYFARENT